MKSRTGLWFAAAGLMAISMAAVAGVAVGQGTATNPQEACAGAVQNAQMSATAQGAKNVTRVGQCQCSSSTDGSIWNCIVQVQFE